MLSKPGQTDLRAYVAGCATPRRGDWAWCLFFRMSVNWYFSLFFHFSTNKIQNSPIVNYFFPTNKFKKENCKGFGSKF